MKILVLADVESKYLWDFYEKSKLEGIDLIISCGDLKANYLSFLATFTSAPVLYVHGNHDTRYETHPPEGCICIDDDIYVHNGVRILGLGGSMCYNYGAHQYTEQDMRKRVRKLWNKLRKNKGFDILVTHAPAYHFNDGDDLPHTGFQIFNELVEKYMPKYFIHGHMHMNYDWKLKQKRECAYNEHTIVVNAYERYEFEYK
ncbi:MAG: metallophosphoesterase family protein [Lachnospiraceae bacterium]|nr:metallophosphoesterase family protein [Lachnospiraceae bacterium]